MTMVIIRDNTPLTVWLEWMVQDGVVFGLIAYTRSGEAVTLTAEEEMEALELAYLEVPLPSY